MAHIISGGYQGRIYPVNPREKELFGLRVYSCLKDIPGPVDLTFVTTPAAVVPSVFRDCVEKSVKAVVVISSGFRETGAEGIQLEQQIVQLAKKAAIPLVGPNTMGFVSTSARLYATGGGGEPRGRSGFLRKPERQSRHPAAQLG